MRVCVCGAGLRTVVHGDDVQAVEQLPLVLVDPLDVHVEHGGRVDLHAVLPLQVLGELLLVVLRGTLGHEGVSGVQETQRDSLLRTVKPVLTGPVFSGGLCCNPITDS